MADLFLKQAGLYAKSRPDYPASLFQMLASLTRLHENAWDVATGNGQAAIMVADHYKSVIATDVSEEQLSHAVKRDNITYAKLSEVSSQEELERVLGPNLEGSVDLVTVAQALHWFDLEKLYAILKSVLRKPGGLVAVWCYTLPRVSPEIDKLLDDFKENVQAPYWDAKRKLVDEEYRTIPFPFKPVIHDGAGVGPRHLESLKQWTFDEYFLYLKSSSAVQTALDHGVDLMNGNVRQDFLSLWGQSELKRTVTFPIFLLLGTE